MLLTWITKYLYVDRLIILWEFTLLHSWLMELYKMRGSCKGNLRAAWQISDTLRIIQRMKIPKQALGVVGFTLGELPNVYWMKFDVMEWDTERKNTRYRRRKKCKGWTQDSHNRQGSKWNVGLPFHTKVIFCICFSGSNVYKLRIKERKKCLHIDEHV